MRLVPDEPPGRLTRKARDFEAEIVQLRGQGYTLEAIRQALAGAGVHVSISTVRREANRHAARRPVLTPASADISGALPPSPRPVSSVSVAPTRWIGTAGPAEGPSGKDIAEAFVRSQSTNPLIRAKEHP